MCGIPGGSNRGVRVCVWRLQGLSLPIHLRHDKEWLSHWTLDLTRTATHCNTLQHTATLPTHSPATWQRMTRSFHVCRIQWIVHEWNHMTADESYSFWISHPWMPHSFHVCHIHRVIHQWNHMIADVYCSFRMHHSRITQSFHGYHMRGSSLSCECDMSHIWMSHISHMNESYHTHEWVMSHIWMSHVTHMNESCHTYEWVMSHIWMSYVTHMNESYHTYEWVISHIHQVAH